jgi:hypothetical protein
MPTLQPQDGASYAIDFVKLSALVSSMPAVSAQLLLKMVEDFMTMPSRSVEGLGPKYFKNTVMNTLFELGVIKTI